MPLLPVDITTREGFLAMLRLPQGCRLGLFELHAGEKGLTHVMAGIIADTNLLALLGARAVLKVAVGKRGYSRIAPEANSYRSLDGIQHHDGYVRFAFADEMGEWLEPNALEKPEAQMQYLGFTEMSEGEAEDVLHQIGIL